MILGQTRNYILGITGILMLSIWSPNKLAYTETPMQCGENVVDNSLVFNSTILRLSAQYDSSERTISTKVALVDSQSRVINSNLKKLNNDNINQNMVNSRGDSSSHITSSSAWQRMQPAGFYNCWVY